MYFRLIIENIFSPKTRFINFRNKLLTKKNNIYLKRVLNKKQKKMRTYDDGPIMSHASAHVLSSAFRVSTWILILVLISITAKDIIREYDSVIKECDQKTCILKFDTSICTISFANTSIPGCPHTGCIQGKEMNIGCDIEEGSQCPKTWCEYKTQPPQWVSNLDNNIGGYIIGLSIFVMAAFFSDVISLFTTIIFVRSEIASHQKESLESDSFIEEKNY